MSDLTPVDILLQKVQQKLEAQELIVSNAYIPPADAPMTQEQSDVDLLMDELNDALANGELTISKTVQETSYSWEMSKEQALELKAHLSDLLDT